MQPQLSSADRRRLKGIAQRLEPVLKVGRNGVSESFVQSVNEALARHELIKLKFVEFKEEKKALADQLAASTQSALVQMVGHVVVLYRPKPAVSLNVGEEGEA